MNKLSVLYSLFKNIKDATDKKGEFKMEVLLDSVVKMSGQATIKCTDGKVEKQVDVQCGEEKYHFEYQGSKCCGGGFHHHMMHKHHEHGGYKEKIAKIMFALKMLNMLKLKEDAMQKYLSLNVNYADLPQEFQGHLKEKQCCANSENAEHNKFHKLFNKECCDIDHSTIVPETLGINMVLDANCSPQSIDVSVQMNGQTTENISKIIELKLMGTLNC